MTSYIKAERKRLQRQRQQKGEEIGRLVTAIAGSPQPLASLTERLAKMESAVCLIDQRLTQIGMQIKATEASVIHPEDVAAALAAFEPVWEVLQPNERTRVVHLLIESAEYDAQWSGLRLVFRVGDTLPIPRSTEDN